MKTAVVVSLVSVVFAAQGDVKQELERLRGTWVVTSAGGKDVPIVVAAALVIAGDTYHGIQNGTRNEGGTIKLDPRTKPASIDMLITEGALTGSTQLGTVEVAGDTMTLILGEPGSSTRPAAGSPNALVLTRIKPIARELEGVWEGASTNPAGQTRRVVVTLRNGADGLATGTLTSVDQGGGEAPIVAVIQRAPRLTLVLPKISAGFDGELKDGQLVGTFRQARSSTPLVLKRK